MKYIILLLSLISINTLANEELQTRDYVRAIDQSLYETEKNLEDTFWYLNRIRVKVDVHASLEVPLVSTLKIKPEVELYFDR